MKTVVSKDGATIAYDAIGSGPAVILVGGAFQHRAFDPRTAEIAAALSDAYTVYHYDRRGRGDSTDVPPYAIGREIEDLDALIQTAGGSAMMFGHSSGAVLALDAVAVGLPVSRLAVYEPPMVVDATRPPAPADYRERLEAAVAAGRRGEAVEIFLTDGVGVPAFVVDQMRSTPMWSGFEQVAHTLPYDAAIEDGLMSGEPAAAVRRWPSIDLPLLVINGRASPEWMRNAADALHDAVAGSVRVELPDQDHGPTVDALAPTLREFFGD